MHGHSKPINSIVISSVILIFLFTFNIDSSSWFEQSEASPSSSDPQLSVYIKPLYEKGIDLVYNQGNYTEAVKYFDNVLSMDPGNVYSLFYKGAALGSLGDLNESVPLIYKSIDF